MMMRLLTILLILSSQCFGQVRLVYPPSTKPIKTRNLTIDHTKCGTAVSTNWFVPYNFTDVTLKQVPSGHVQNVNGYDIEFFSDAACTILLAWRILSYNSTTGQIVVIIGQANLSNTTDLTIYMRYGDASITTFQGAVAGNPFNTGFMGFWPLNEASAPYHDITANGNNSTAGTYPSQTTGVFFNGQSFNASSAQYISVPHNSSLNASTNYTFNGVINQGSNTGSYKTFLSKRGTTSVTNYEVGTDISTNGLYLWGGSSYTASTATIGSGTPHQVTITAGSTGNSSFYIDGGTPVTTAIPLGPTNTNALNIGSATPTDQFMKGTEEMVSVCNFQWTSSNSIATYNLLFNNSTTITTGAEH